jgi:hypothetical protein
MMKESYDMEVEPIDIRDAQHMHFSSLSTKREEKELRSRVIYGSRRMGGQVYLDHSSQHLGN